MDFVGHGVVASNETEVAFGEFDRTFDVDDGFLFHFVEVVALNECCDEIICWTGE